MRLAPSCSLVIKNFTLLQISLLLLVLTIVSSVAVAFTCDFESSFPTFWDARLILRQRVLENWLERRGISSKPKMYIPTSAWCHSSPWKDGGILCLYTVQMRESTFHSASHSWWASQTNSEYYLVCRRPSLGYVQSLWYPDIIIIEGQLYLHLSR